MIKAVNHSGRVLKKNEIVDLPSDVARQFVGLNIAVEFTQKEMKTDYETKELKPVKRKYKKRK